MSYCPLMAGTTINIKGNLGIRAATARQAAVAGYNVCINYVTHAAKSVDLVVAECETLGRKVLAVKVDVGNAKDVAELFTACGNAFGPVSLPVNSASIIGKATSNGGSGGVIANASSVAARLGIPDQPVMSPLGRFASPNGIAAEILWLASPESNYVTGAVLPVSGGL